MGQTAAAWQAGLRISVRGQLWTIVELTTFEDCEGVRVRGAEAANRAALRTLLMPFDRPRLLQTRSILRVMRPRRWLQAVIAEAAAASPFGGMSSAAGCPIAFIPYQFEPGLAMLREGHTRILIADAVGLGKTIQAGVILKQLATERETFRALVVAPAGLRDQWASELETRLRLGSNIVTSDWLSRTVAKLPLDINPWSLPGIYITSFDFIKRPEVLRPLEEMTWDVVVVDEAHAATDRSYRRAAVHALATRARRVILLSATPDSGDPGQFDALCSIGDTGSPHPILIFNRSRADTGATGRRRTVLLAVHLSAAETRMHRALEAYAARLCAESKRRDDRQARLAAVILAKRALSSAASLARSCRRRAQLLAAGDTTANEEQIGLPFAEEDALDDGEPSSALAAPGLTDPAREQEWLLEIAVAAEQAAQAESKIARLKRLLRRTREPAIVFTEYRDTLEHLRQRLAALRRPLVVLHGGMTPPERSAAQREFNRADALMLATDAASEGLNLHHRCRTVIHFELPWNPSRLEQRTGRVDRIGQQRTVHEIFLVAHDTAERLVLAPLARRAARVHGAVRERGRLGVLTESRVAAAVMEGTPLEAVHGTWRQDYAVPTPELAAAARREAARLEELSAWLARGPRHDVAEGIPTTVLLAKHGALPPGIISIYKLSTMSPDGNVRHDELIPVHSRWPLAAIRHTPASLRLLVNEFRRAMSASIEARLHADLVVGRIGEVARDCERVDAAARERTRAIANIRRSAAQRLVQAGLFERRARQNGLIPLAPPPAESGELRAGATLHSADSSPPAASLTLTAILVVSSRRDKSFDVNGSVRGGVT